MVDMPEFLKEDLRSMARHLRSDMPQPGDLTRQDWRSVIEVLTGAIQATANSLTLEEWRAVSEAFLLALATATEAGAITQHEGLVRRLNMTLTASDSRNSANDVLLLNPSSAVSAALDALPSHPDAVARLGERWRELPRAEVLALRRIKNLLTPTIKLCDRLGDSRLEGWEQAYQALP